MASKVTCSNCGWSWNKSDSSKKDMYVCHQCGRDNSNKSEGWLDKYDDGGTMQEYQENYNDYSVSAPEEMQGDGYSNVGRDYSPAWGGQFKDGGRTNSSTPIIDDAGNYNEKGNWIPDWKNMTAQAKKLGAKKVRTKHGSLIIFNDNWEVVGVDDNPDAMQMGGSLPNAQRGLTFLQPTSDKLPEGYVIPYNTPSTELAMSIGGEDGEPAYLIPSFKGGRKLKDPIAEYKKTGEHLGGPFKTWQEAEKFGEMRHKYVEKGQDIPTPIKTWGDMAMGGSLPGFVGFTYARTGNIPSNGKYAKKTKASAQDGDVFPKREQPTPASESTSTIRNIKGEAPSTTATTGQRKGDVKLDADAMKRFKAAETKDKQKRIAERKSAIAAKDKGKPFTLPTGETKKYEDMDWREKAYVSGKSLESKGRANEDDEAWYDEINPVNWLTSSAGGLATAPYEARESNSNMPYVGAALNPLIQGALGFDPLGGAMKVPGRVVRSMESGVLSNAYKLNPFAFKPNESNWYRQVGKSAIDDALETGLVREAGEEVSPRMLQEFEEQLVRMQGNGMDAVLAGKRPISPFFAKGELFYPMGRKPTINKLTGKISKNPAGKGSADHLIETSLSNESFQPAYVKGMRLGVPKEIGETAILKPNPSLRDIENFKLYKQDWLKGYKEVPRKEQGGVVKDDMGYWNPDNHGKVVEIDSNDITMEGVDEPLIGISDEGDQQYMTPGNNYKFKGTKVREYPMAKNGKRQEQKGLINLDDLLNFTNYNIPKAYEGMELSTITDTTTVNPNSPENKKKYGSPDEKSIDQFYRDYYNSPLFKKNIGISEGKLSEYPNIASSSDPKLINSILAKHAEVNTTYNPDKITAYDLGSNVNLGSSYDDVFQDRGLTYAHEKSHVDENNILKRQPKMVDFLINKNKLSTKYDKRDIEEYNKNYANFQDEYSPVTHERILTKAEGQQNALERLLKQKQQYTSELTHDNAPTEIRADIMGLRYAAAQAGIWDPTKPNAGNFTPEMLQKLYKLQKLNLPMKGRSFNKPYELIAPNKESLRKSNLPAVDAPKSPGLFLDRTRQRFDDSDLLYLMNNLAQNQSPMTSEMTTGKDGAKVKKGWLEKYN